MKNLFKEADSVLYEVKIPWKKISFEIRKI